MTIDTSVFPSESLVVPSKRRFYPIHIPTPHNQLRHLISTADQDWIYYIASHDVYCLHIPTQRKHILVTLPFSGRCISAGLGWIAVGGDSRGECAFIKITWRSENPQVEVDASLPLELRPASQQQSSDSNPDAALEPWPEVILQELGKDIVNSVVIHNLARDQSKLPAPVVVLCNNDKTVKVYSLQRQEVIADLEHPVSMNYGIISPDSNHLVAVGDNSQIYFHRLRVGSAKAMYYNYQPLENYTWDLVAVPDHWAENPSQQLNHFFSIAFSPSGHLCAVASQLGMIAIYDMSILSTMTLEDEPKQACYCTFKSSRPFHQGGAVRSMAFSPAPWDLLAWVEEHGKVGVADVRQAFWRRQMLNLEPDGENVEKLPVEDVTDEFIRSMDTEGRLSYQYGVTSSFLNDPVEADPSVLSDVAAHRRRLRREVRARTRSLRSQNSGIEDLTERERQVLASLGSRYPRDEALLLWSRSGQPYSINYTSSPRTRSALADEDNQGPGSRADMLRRIMRNNADTPSPGSSQAHNDSTDRSLQPRRRSSVILSANLFQSSSTLAPITDSSTELSAPLSAFPAIDLTNNSGASRLSDDPSASQLIARPLDRNDPDDAWDLIQSALEAPRRSSPAVEFPPEVEAELSRQSRQLAAQRQRQSSPGSSSTTARTSTLPTTSTASHMMTPEAPRRSRPAEEFFPPEIEAQLSRQSAALLQRQSSLGSSSTVARTSTLPTTSTASHMVAPQSSIPRDLTSELSPPRVLTPADLQPTLTNDERQRRPLIPPGDVQAPTLAPRHHPSTIDFLRQRAQRATASRPRSASGAGGVSGSSGEVYSTMRLARMMMQRTGDTNTDANGNWIAGEALQRVLRSSVPEEGGFLDDQMYGVGTAGVGWSRDGRLLYVGTKAGIFELTTNLEDRMAFSDIAFR